MKEQKIVWTVLPNGVGKTETGDPGLKLSVFVSPRLKTDENLPEPHLEQFPDFSKNWPKKVKTMKFGVEFDNGATASATLDESKLDIELWSVLFKESTFVRPYEFKDYKDRIIRTYPVQGVLSYLKKKYVAIAENSPNSVPLLEPRRDDEGKLIDDPDATLEAFINDLGDLLKPEKIVICKLSDKVYGEFKGHLVEGAFDRVLTYIEACLRKKKYQLSDDAKISKIDDNNWKITDGKNEYYLEDTGTELNVYQYSDIYSKLDEELEKSKALDPNKLYGFAKEKLDFLQANRFYDRREKEQPYYFKPNAKMVPPPPEIPKIDFHQMLTTLGDHPLLLRKLGLVLDFLIPVPNHPFSSIRLIPIWSDDAPPSNFNEDLTPRTKCIFKKNRFMAQSKPGSKLKNGMLDLTDADDDHDGGSAVYSLVQVDPDGAALKIVNSADSMRRQIKKRYLCNFSEEHSKKIIKDCDISIDSLRGYSGEIHKDFRITNKAKISKVSSNKWMITDGDNVYEIKYNGKKLIAYKKINAVAYDTPEDAGLSSLRSAGIALTKFGRAFDLNQHFAATFPKNQDLEKNDPNKPVDLYADELVRGYRVDVLDETFGGNAGWRSLCRRVGAYTFPESSANALSVDDEGYVKGASTTSKDSKDSDLYLHETVFRWDGWSLCAQRPGKTIVSETSEEEVYLFNWDDVTVNNQEFIEFLENYLNARWAKNANIQKSDSKTITVEDTDHSIKLSIEGINEVILKTDHGKEYIYVLKEEDGKRNVYTTVVKQDEKPGVIANKAVTEFKLESAFSAKPGSLPCLRFGHIYRLRARTVDIAGNSKSWESNDSSQASKSLHYARYEPLIPPAIVPRARLSEGEAVERMVIRSNFDKTTKEHVEALIGENYAYEEGNERHIVPPKTSQLTAETHGEFDAFFGEGKDYGKGYNIALKEEGTLFDPEIVNTATGIKESIPNPDDVEIIVPPPPEGMSPDETPGQYVIHKEEQLLLPYLPDPIACGAAFRDLPGVTSNGTPELEKIIDPQLGLNLIKIPFDLLWPDAKPFRIRIEERPGKIEGDSCDETFDNFEDPPKWDPNNRILTVFLAKAQVARVRYGCYMDKNDLAVMGIWKWLRGSSIKGKLEKYALSGSHWMLTPYRELVLVHAVQQPLCEPTIPVLNAIKKKIGDTFANIEGEFHLSVKSTNKIDLLANWTEPVDDLAKDEPGTIDVNAHGFELKIEESFKDTMNLPLKPCVNNRHEFGDTKYRHVKYYLQGATRFREYFHPEITGAINEYCFNWDDVPGCDSQQIIDFLRVNRKMDYTENATIEKTLDGETITITENGITVTLKLNKEKTALILKTSEGKEYIYVLRENEEGKLCIYTDKITRKGPIYEVDVLNSARPAAPKVLYIIPTFGWEEKKVPQHADIWKEFERKMIGGGVRVYLDRPWYSSGDGELLGVVLLYSHIIRKLKPYVTQWGMDPIRKSSMPKGALTRDDFVNTAGSQKGLSLEELADPKVDVVGFKPEYNKDRKLWYCDIQINPEVVTSYYPFIRLALARYQPKSIPDAHLSRVVLTDFVQLANDRTLNITFDGDDKNFYISVSGYGTADRSSNRVEMSIETLPPGSHEEFGWIPIKGTKGQPNPCTLKLSPLDAKTYLWKWDAKLKLPQSRKSKTFRLVVREYEKFKADKDNVILLATKMEESYLTEEEERLVYADVVNISP